MTTEPLGDIAVSDTAAEKRGRYLTPAQLRTALREGSGRVYRRSSPNHDGLYDQRRFVIRGTFAGTPLDIVFAVETGRVVVVTQMSQHATTLEGRFYEAIGTTAADAAATLDD